MLGRWLLYGAYGFTGRLITQQAVARGLTPVLAGRNAKKTKDSAERLGLEYRAFSLDNAAAVRDGVSGMAAVLHSAGPFSHTYRAMMDACLAVGAHYLDITGEIPVFEGLFRSDARAKEAGVVLLPGVGFDVVPTDCAAARAVALLPDATHLELAFKASGSTSRGTTRSMVEGLGHPGVERVNGEFVAVPHGTLQRIIPFSSGERNCVAIPWGDVSTAYHSTGVPNVRVYATAGRRQLRAMALARNAGWLLGAPPVQAFLKWVIGRTVTGPDERELETGSSCIWCEARNAARDTVTVELTTPNGYTLTADSAVTAIERLLGDDYAGPAAGFLTPSRAFGHTFVDGLKGVEWVSSL